MGVKKLDVKVRAISGILDTSEQEPHDLDLSCCEIEAVGRDPVQISNTVLVCDGWGLMYFACNFLTSRPESGLGSAFPNYVKLDEFLRNHISTLRRNGITLQVVFDGTASTDLKAATKEFRSRGRDRDWNSRFRQSHLQFGQSVPESFDGDARLAVLSSLQFKSTLEGLNVTTIYATGEAEVEISRRVRIHNNLAREDGCDTDTHFAYGNDSDFMLMENCPYIKFGDIFENDSTIYAKKVWRRAEVAALLGLSEPMLVEFGLAMGNDFTSEIDRNKVFPRHDAAALGSCEGMDNFEVLLKYVQTQGEFEFCSSDESIEEALQYSRLFYGIGYEDANDDVFLRRWKLPIEYLIFTKQIKTLSGSIDSSTAAVSQAALELCHEFSRDLVSDDHIEALGRMVELMRGESENMPEAFEEAAAVRKLVPADSPIRWEDALAGYRYSQVLQAIVRAKSSPAHLSAVALFDGRLYNGLLVQSEKHTPVGPAPPAPAPFLTPAGSTSALRDLIFISKTLTAAVAGQTPVGRIANIPLLIANRRARELLDSLRADATGSLHDDINLADVVDSHFCDRQSDLADYLIRVHAQPGKAIVVFLSWEGGAARNLKTQLEENPIFEVLVHSESQPSADSVLHAMPAPDRVKIVLATKPFFPYSVDLPYEVTCVIDAAQCDGRLLTQNSLGRNLDFGKCLRGNPLRYVLFPSPSANLPLSRYPPSSPFYRFEIFWLHGSIEVSSPEQLKALVSEAMGVTPNQLFTVFQRSNGSIAVNATNTGTGRMNAMTESRILRKGEVLLLGRRVAIDRAGVPTDTHTGEAAVEWWPAVTNTVSAKLRDGASRAMQSTSEYKFQVTAQKRGGQLTDLHMDPGTDLPPLLLPVSATSVQLHRTADSESQGDYSPPPSLLSPATFARLRTLGITSDGTAISPRSPRGNTGAAAPSRGVEDGVISPRLPSGELDYIADVVISNDELGNVDAVTTGSISAPTGREHFILEATPGTTASMCTFTIEIMEGITAEALLRVLHRSEGIEAELIPPSSGTADSTGAFHFKAVENVYLVDLLHRGAVRAMGKNLRVAAVDLVPAPTSQCVVFTVERIPALSAELIVSVLDSVEGIEAQAISSAGWEEGGAGEVSVYHFAASSCELLTGLLQAGTLRVRAQHLRVALAVPRGPVQPQQAQPQSSVSIPHELSAMSDIATTIKFDNTHHQSPPDIPYATTTRTVPRVPLQALQHRYPGALHDITGRSATQCRVVARSEDQDLCDVHIQGSSLLSVEVCDVLLMTAVRESTIESLNATGMLAATAAQMNVPVHVLEATISAMGLDPGTAVETYTAALVSILRTRRSSLIQEGISERGGETRTF